MVIILVAYFFPSDDEKQNPTVKKDVVEEKKINSAGRLKLTKQYNDPGYVESSFPQKESFWIFIKNPPKGEYAVNYATVVCNQAKNNYDAKGFVITIWGLLDKKEYGKFPCY